MKAPSRLWNAPYIPLLAISNLCFASFFGVLCGSAVSAICIHSPIELKGNLLSTKLPEAMVIRLMDSVGIPASNKNQGWHTWELTVLIVMAFWQPILWKVLGWKAAKCFWSNYSASGLLFLLLILVLTLNNNSMKGSHMNPVKVPFKLRL